MSASSLTVRLGWGGTLALSLPATCRRSLGQSRQLLRGAPGMSVSPRRASCAFTLANGAINPQAIGPNFVRMHHHRGRSLPTTRSRDLLPNGPYSP